MLTEAQHGDAFPECKQLVVERMLACCMMANEQEIAEQLHIANCSSSPSPCLLNSGPPLPVTGRSSTHYIPVRLHHCRNGTKSQGGRLVCLWHCIHTGTSLFGIHIFICSRPTAGCALNTSSDRFTLKRRWSKLTGLRLSSECYGNAIPIGTCLLPTMGAFASTGNGASSRRLSFSVAGKFTLRKDKTSMEKRQHSRSLPETPHQ